MFVNISISFTIHHKLLHYRPMYICHACQVSQGTAVTEGNEGTDGSEGIPGMASAPAWKWQLCSVGPCLKSTLPSISLRTLQALKGQQMKHWQPLMVPQNVPDSVQSSKLGISTFRTACTAGMCCVGNSWCFRTNLLDSISAKQCLLPGASQQQCL